MVLSPALGGVVIGHEVARALGVRAMFAERQDGALTLRRGFMIGETDRVLVVEDVLTTGGSTRETMQVAKAAGGQVVGAAAIVDRGGRTAAAIRRAVRGAARRSICRPTSPSECPLCAQGLPVDKTRIAAGGVWNAEIERSPLSRSDPHDAHFRITVAYDGTDFVGWQRQAAGVSIQGLLEDALPNWTSRRRRGRCRAHRCRRARARAGGDDSRLRAPCGRCARAGAQRPAAA